MTISATTQGIRPGVATSSTRPTVPFDGQVISETDTDTLQIYKGSAWGPASGVVLIETLSPSAAATTQFTTGSLSSTYKFYTVKYNLNNQFSTNLRSAGSTITAANYTKWVIGSTSTDVGSGDYVPSGTSMVSYNRDGFIYRGTLELHDPSVSQTQIIYQTGGYVGYSGATNQNSYTTFTYDVAQAYDSLLFTATAGTLTGTIKLYGWS